MWRKQMSFVTQQKLWADLVFQLVSRHHLIACDYIHLSLRQGTAYPSMTTKLCSLSYFEHSSNYYFSMHSLLILSGVNALKSSS